VNGHVFVCGVVGWDRKVNGHVFMCVVTGQKSER
jgi:hypothetical protein